MITKKQTSSVIWKSGFASRMLLLLLCALGWLGSASRADAQTSQFTNTTTGAINGTTTCTAPLVRNFTVAASFSVADVNLGLLATHTWRGDIQVTLQSPAGTRVQLVNGTGAQDGDNFNVLLDNAGTQVVNTDLASGNHSTSAPPYQNVFIPNAALSAFNGQNSAGTWRLEVCDTFSGADNGSFLRSDLYLTQATSADLSLTQSVSTTSPQSGARIDYTLTVTNNSASTATATGIQVSNILNASLIYRSQTGTGTFDPATSIWTVGSLAPGASATKVITVANNALPGTTISNYAQIISSSASDPDSTVNNGSTTEDDDETTSITIANFPPAGTPPALTCPVASAIFDWDAQAWTSGALTGSFNVANIGPIALNITGATNRLVADPLSASASPVRNTSTTGGATGQNSLMFVLDLANTSESVNATWTFTNGVSGLQFTMADIDLLFGQFEDRVTVTGSYKGVAVTPTLTNFGANTVSGNSATATALATNTNADGNVRVTFSSPVDTVTVNYGSTAGAPADPGIQAIALMDMTVCGAATDLALSKQVSNGSPSTGAAISYTLTATNTTATAMDTSGVAVADALPAGFTFISASGTGSYNSGTGVWTIGTLAKGATATLTINGTVSASAGTTVTNIAQISASLLPDPDSTVNNGVTTEDDYAAVAFTVPSIFNCPTGSTATGSGYTTGGTGLYQNQIFWLDWNCGATTSFPSGSIINKSWDAGDGLVINGQVSAITLAIAPYNSGNGANDLYDNLYPGVNPVGLRNAVGGADPQFTLTLTGTLNGQTFPLRYVVSEVQDLGGAASLESIEATTNGSNWQLVEQAGSITINNTGTQFILSDPATAGGGTAILETTASNLTLNMSMFTGATTASGFGVFTPFDYSDAPLTGTSYGSANHRTIANYILGASVTTEAAAYDSPNASGDGDNGVITAANLIRGQAGTVNVNVQGLGRLSGWIDFNDDGDWADAGEKVATDIIDGGAGDLDATVNGVIQMSVTPPVGAATTPTIMRLRYSSRANAPASGLWGFGEVEDYELTIINPSLSATKISSVVSDGISGSNPKAIPGATIRYCITVENTGNTAATAVAMTDNLPANTIFIAGSMLTGTSCATAAQVEDNDDTGTDETDPFGMSFAAGGTNGTGIVTGTASSLAAGGTMALVFNVQMN